MREFEAELAPVSFSPPAIPVIANVTAAPYDPARLCETLARQIGRSVRWLDSILYLLDQGATHFEEVGPGRVLTGLVAKIQDART